MKHLFTLFAAILLFAATSQAQCDQTKYDKFIAEGDKFFTARNYTEALNSYNAAMIACKERMLEVQRKTKAVFTKINQLKDDAEKAQKQALAEKEKAEKAEKQALLLVEALTPIEARADKFGYFWRQGKQFWAKFAYVDAYNNLLLALNADNMPPEKRDSVQKLYNQAEVYNNLYKNAAELFYSTEKDRYTKAQKLFADIVKRNPADSLTLAMLWACGDYRTENMVKVKGDEFMMGSQDGGEDERPVHKVTLSDFEISKYEVTNAQYARFLNDFTQHHKGLDISDSIERFIDLSGAYNGEFGCGIMVQEGKYKAKPTYENRPCTYVSWYGADAFCRFYGGKLPTEAQWEYAAGGGQLPESLKLSGSLQKYSGTNNADSLYRYANYYNSKDGYEYTSPVGKFLPNALGLYDMSGNVYEWCADWYKGYPGSTGSFRVLRGGSWSNNASGCRVAFRYRINPNDGNYYLGFRLVFVP